MRASRGFTLIEVLIAFVLLSVGLLGVVSLQGLAKTNQHQALQRSLAISLADSMLERIRINPGQAGGAYNIGSDNALDGGSMMEPGDCHDPSCTPAEMADRDLWELNQGLGGGNVTSAGATSIGLIEPRACIWFDSAAGKLNTGEVEILITWRGLLSTTDAVQTDDSSCGGASAGEDTYRRKLAVNSWLIDEAEL